MIQRALILLIRGYRLLLSPWLGASCRFYPTCSVYSIESLERHGAAAGSYLMLRRLCRCNPWCEGGFDEVPERVPGLFSRFTTKAATPAGARPVSSSPQSESSP